MNDFPKRHFLDLIAEEQLPEAIDQLRATIPAGHPGLKRLNQLAARLRELEERIDMGTLADEDIARTRTRIAGGLRDVVQEYEPLPEQDIDEVPQEPAFKLEPLPEKVVAPPATKDMGFRDEIVYKGSPSKRERSIELVKSYGAAYHQVLQALKKAGMTMEKADRAGGRLSASIPPTSSAKFGEVIEVWLRPEQAGRTWVQVVVDSASPATSFDFGRHESKLNLLFSYLR